MWAVPQAAKPRAERWRGSGYHFDRHCRLSLRGSKRQLEPVTHHADAHVFMNGKTDSVVGIPGCLYRCGAFGAGEGCALNGDVSRTGRNPPTSSRWRCKLYPIAFRTHTHVSMHRKPNAEVGVGNALSSTSA